MVCKRCLRRPISGLFIWFIILGVVYLVKDVAELRNFGRIKKNPEIKRKSLNTADILPKLPFLREQNLHLRQVVDHLNQTKNTQNEPCDGEKCQAPTQPNNLHEIDKISVAIHQIKSEEHTTHYDQFSYEIPQSSKHRKPVEPAKIYHQKVENTSVEQLFEEIQQSSEATERAERAYLKTKIDPINDSLLDPTPPAYTYHFTDLGFEKIHLNYQTNKIIQNLQILDPDKSLYLKNTPNQNLPVQEDRDFLIFENKLKSEINFNSPNNGFNTFGFDALKNKHLPLFRSWDLSFDPYGGKGQNNRKNNDNIPVPELQCSEQYNDWKSKRESRKSKDNGKVLRIFSRFSAGSCKV